MPYVPKFQNHLASYACITVSGLIFLRDSHCSLQTKRREFLPCYSYISESLIGWVFNQLKSLTDRSRFFHKIGVGGGGGVWGAKSNEKFSGGGGRCHIMENSVGGVLVRKEISRFEISRGRHLWDLTFKKIFVI